MADATNGTSPINGRRRLILSLAAILSLTAVPGSWSRGKQERRGPTRKRLVSGADASLSKARTGAKTLMESYPEPRWLPEDFKLQQALACSSAPFLEGPFLGVDDNQQLSLYNRRASARTHADFINAGLLIYLAPAEQMPQLRGWVGADSEPLALRIADGDTVGARYYGTGLKDQHPSVRLHSVALHRRGFAILVTSFRKNRLTRADLERVAASIT